MLWYNSASVTVCNLQHALRCLCWIKRSSVTKLNSNDFAGKFFWIFLKLLVPIWKCAKCDFLYLPYHLLDNGRFIRTVLRFKLVLSIIMCFVLSTFVSNTSNWIAVMFCLLMLEISVVNALSLKSIWINNLAKQACIWEYLHFWSCIKRSNSNGLLIQISLR